jgi:hypothetical protein
MRPTPLYGLLLYNVILGWDSVFLVELGVWWRSVLHIDRFLFVC